MRPSEGADDVSKRYVPGPWDRAGLSKPRSFKGVEATGSVVRRLLFNTPTLESSARKGGMKMATERNGGKAGKRRPKPKKERLRDLAAKDTRTVRGGTVKPQQGNMKII